MDPAKGVSADPPLAFFDMSWMAVEGGEPDVIADVLKLSSPVAVTWTQGLHAVAGDFWDDRDCQNSRVFVSPLVEGWRLIVGGWCRGTGDEDFRAIAEFCRLLSERYGAACAFTSQGRMDFYSWTLARSGELRRLFVPGEDDDPDIDEGTAPEFELQLKQAERLWPSEDAVMSIARAFSIAPIDLGPHMQSVGQGFMFTTTWGRAHGVPQRPLCNCAGGQASCE